MKNSTVSVHDIMTDILLGYQRWEDEQMEKHLRLNVYPPIEGELTKGKLKWRGVVLCQSNDSGIKIERWLEQRGVAITPKFSLKSPNLP